MKKLLLNNIGTKIGALLLSLILWIFVMSKGRSEITLDVPLEFKNIPKGIETVYQDAKTVSVSIEGQERLIKNLKPQDMRVYVDLSKAKKGEGTYYISKDNVKLPRSMNVVKITPATLKIVTDEMVTVTLPVKPLIIGTPKSGYAVSSVKVIPRDVVVEGAASEVRKMNLIKTESIDISGLDGVITQEVRLNSSGRNFRTSVGEVKVTIAISRGHK